MIEQLKKSFIKAIEKIGIHNPKVHFEHPENHKFGDLSTNIAMVYAKELKLFPKVLAQKIIDELKNDLPDEVNSLNIAGPGFINIKLKDIFFTNKIAEFSKEKDIGKNKLDENKKIMIEYTDPNPFKIFHIGHLMANTVGESLSRIVEFSGAKVIRACYQGDIGLHVAKTIWAILQDGKFQSNVKYLGDMYVIGNEKYETDENAKKEIIKVNKKIFEKSDKEINEIYKKGRDLSLEYFDTIYKKLGTKFDNFFFESEVFEDGLKIVKEFLKKGIFENSDGAVIFPGEKYGTHTRVFITKESLPTYEAKDLGLARKKFDTYPDLKESISVTANEQDTYFKVILAVLKEIYPDIASKTKHISHGILRPPSGKMSSRKGNIVDAEELIGEFESLVEEKLKDKKFDKKEYEEIRETVAVSALKYTILRQAIGGDIIYDPKKAVSFEGDSGPYLQYSTVRANAVIMKAKEAGISETVKNFPEKVEFLEKLIERFPEIIKRARLEYSPHYIVTYLTELSSAFNSYYAQYQIIDKKDSLSPYRLMLTKVFAKIMKNGLWVLGIEVPERM